MFGVLRCSVYIGIAFYRGLKVDTVSVIETHDLFSSFEFCLSFSSCWKTSMWGYSIRSFIFRCWLLFRSPEMRLLLSFLGWSGDFRCSWHWSWVLFKLSGNILLFWPCGQFLVQWWLLVICACIFLSPFGSSITHQHHGGYASSRWVVCTHNLLVSTAHCCCCCIMSVGWMVTLDNGWCLLGDVTLELLLLPIHPVVALLRLNWDIKGARTDHLLCLLTRCLLLMTAFITGASFLYFRGNNSVCHVCWAPNIFEMASIKVLEAWKDLFAPQLKVIWIRELQIGIALEA